MPKAKIITGLDIGSQTIKVLVAQKKSQESNFKVLAMAEEVSSGIRRGVVINPSEVTEVLKRLFKKIDSIYPVREIISHGVYINIGGSHIFSTTSRGLISTSRADQKISAEDIERVLQAAQTISLPSNREILEVFPKEFITDGERGIKEPLGLQAVRLEVEALVVAGFTPYIKNLTTTALNSNLQINDLISSPLAGCRAILTPREKELGVCFLDIGASTIGLAVFEEGNLIHLAVLPLGSGHITKDIAIFLKTDIDIAERIKLEFGNLFSESNKKEKIKISEEETLIFSQKQLAKIITIRVSEIFGEVNRELKKISRQNLLPAGVVLTGGGSKLPKIREMAKRELKLFCRIGKPQGFSPPLEDPRFSVVAGLVLTGADLEKEQEFSLSRRGIGEKLKRIFKIFIP